MTERSGEETWTGDLTEGLARQGITVVTVDGSAILDKQTFLEAFARALRFPDYFGANWDAFDECLRDLDWLQAKGVLLVYREADTLRRSSPEDWRLASASLLDAVEHWRGRGFSFGVLFA